MVTYQSDICSNRFIISVDGHAGAAPVGSDIVCSAVSILALSLVEAAKKLDSEGELTSLYHSVSKGSVQLDFTVKERALERAKTVVDVMTDAFLLLEEHYPECVCVE